MIRLCPQTLPGYLQTNGFDVSGASLVELAWGVSNRVFRVNRTNEPDLVVKQSCEQLRTEIEWKSQLERNAREAEVQKYLHSLELPARIPRVIHVDESNHTFVMDAIDASHTVWKQALLDGHVSVDVFTSTAVTLATIHRNSRLEPPPQHSWNDRTVFDELRIDPFYRWVSSRNPSLRPVIDQLVCCLETTGLCVVLADFSPKNILLTQEGLALVDFETAHLGDPAFDMGFFLSHLVLKSLRATPGSSQIHDGLPVVWETYHQTLEGTQKSFAAAGLPFEARCVRHLAACMLARIEGKSPVDYLSETESATARKIAVEALTRPTHLWVEFLELLTDLQSRNESSS